MRQCTKHIYNKKNCHACLVLIYLVKGNFSCQCKPGYELWIPYSGCTDINECAASSYACINYNTKVRMNFCFENSKFKINFLDSGALKTIFHKYINHSKNIFCFQCTNTIGNYTCTCNTGTFQIDMLLS